MKFDFNKVMDRKDNNSAKWLDMKNNYISNDLLPMWIADMDINVAPQICEAIREKAKQDIFGYVSRPDSYYQSAADWSLKRFNYKIDPNTLIHSPGVNLSIHTLINMFTKENEKIIMHTPVYYPFLRVVKFLKRDLVECELLQDESGEYYIDFEKFENILKTQDIKLMIFVNPHNPLGRVWQKDELKKLGDLCIKYNVKVISDEIWRDLILPNHSHTPFASISKEIENNTITCFSPTKAFNLAGLHASFTVLPKKDEWLAFDKQLEMLDVRRNNHFSLVAVEAAYTKCEDWLNQLMIFIEGNIDYAINFIKTKLPELRVVKPQGTYLLWVDFKNLNLRDESLSHFIQYDAGIAFDDGNIFGGNGATYQRINLACPRSMVEDCMNRLEKAVIKWRKENERS